MEKSSANTRTINTQIVVFSCLWDQTAFMDLVDVFAVPAEQPPSEPQWVGQNQAAAHLGATDPWDSLGESDSPLPHVRKALHTVQLPGFTPLVSVR